MLMSVSMVVAPWRRLVHVARWNGHAPHTTTGEARAKASHCHSSNCSAGTIDSAITGMASAAVTTQPLARLRRPARCGRGRAAWSLGAWASWSVGPGGRRRSPGSPPRRRASAGSTASAA